MDVVQEPEQNDQLWDTRKTHGRNGLAGSGSTASIEKHGGVFIDTPVSIQNPIHKSNEIN